jgi:2-polyprenyl-6-methoxyphenol hydroxylase-like FAD-dependent oxidoreductase
LPISFLGILTAGMVETNVLIVGGGPVGMTLAMDLAWRGIDVIIVETRRAGEPPNVKCNQVSARSMEVFRRLGLSSKLRQAGLPAGYSNDVVSATTVTGIELSRLSLPSRDERQAGVQAVDSWWPTPEPSYRINQTYFEPVLYAHASSQPRIRILNRSEFESFVQDENGVAAEVRNLDSGERLSIVSRYLVGCDGSRSIVRKQIGGEFAGTPEIQRVQSTYVHAPALMALLPGKPAWMYFSLNPRRCGTTIAIDGKANWNIHNFLYSGEPAFDSIDRDWAIRSILGVGPDFHYEVISKEDWMGRRLVADTFRDRRVFICGDAAHLWIPAAGYGMNAGIADAANLSWMIAGVLGGWAHPHILDAYAAERQPITDQASHVITDVALRVMKQRREVPPEVEAPGPSGDQARARIAAEARAIDLQQQCAAGLNFGYFYANSPIVAYDGEPHPGYSIHEFTSSTVPGCRVPHVWLGPGRSLYDALGAGYALIRTDPFIPVVALSEAAASRGLPLSIIDLDPADPQVGSLYKRKLTLVRPDQHVAWRGQELPDAPLALIDLVRGAAANNESVYG